MEKTKKILNISIAVSIILCSLSLLIYSMRSNTAYAQSSNNNFDIHGVISFIAGGNDIYVFEYYPKTNEIKLLAKQPFSNY